MAKNKIPSIVKAFGWVTLYVVISALLKLDITMSLVILVAIYNVQNRILLRKFLDAYNNDEETEEE